MPIPFWGSFMMRVTFEESGQKPGEKMRIYVEML